MAQKRQDRTEDSNSTAVIGVVVLLCIAVVFTFLFMTDTFNLRFKAVDPRLWLGVETIELTADVKKQFNLLVTSGILVSRVFMGSPAQVAGIKEGDVIQRWNGVSLTNQVQFQYLIQTALVDDWITFTVDRQGQHVLVYAKVGIRPGGI